MMAMRETARFPDTGNEKPEGEVVGEGSEAFPDGNFLITNSKLGNKFITLSFHRYIYP